MRPSRIVLISIVGLAALVAAGALALYGVARTSWFERKVGERLSRELDTTVVVGRLALGYFPALSVQAGEVAVAESRAPGAGALVELDRARLVVPWRTVFGGGLNLTRLQIGEPGLRLAVAADGRGNWEPLMETLAGLGGDGPSAWSLGTLEVGGGALRYTDARDGSAFELTAVEITASDLAPGAFFPFTWRFAGHGPDFVMHAALTGESMLDPDRSAYAARGVEWRGWLGGLGLGTGGVELAGTLAALQADLEAGTAALEGIVFEGLGLRATGRAAIAGLEDGPRVDFMFGTEPFAPRALANSLNRPLPATTDPAALARAVVHGWGAYAAGGLTLSRIEGELDETQLGGRIALPAAGPPQLRLDVDRIDLDRYLPPEAPAAGTPRATLEALLGDLATLDVDADLWFGEVRAAGATARGLRLVIEPNPREPEP